MKIPYRHSHFQLHTAFYKQAGKWTVEGGPAHRPAPRPVFAPNG